MTIKLLNGSFQRHDITTRMPFKYGIATMTEVPHVFVTVNLLVDGVACIGHSADHLPPKWFTKEPEAPLEKEITEMEDSLVQALNAGSGLEADTPFGLWKALYDALMTPPEYPPLLQHFGISLVERAVIDATCRHFGQPLWKLVRDNRLGIELGTLSPELKGTTPADWLPPDPLPEGNLRHTVGMADYLWESDVPSAERLEDGLPQSLESCIAHYGLREFKLKLSGQADADLARLRDIASLVTEKVPGDFRFSLDGNEQFATPEALSSFGEAVIADPLLGRFFDHLMFIEQPINRKVALGPDAPDVSAAWPRPVPIIIDESDGALEDFPRALELGYAGVSHKNCKGVFKGIRNRCLIGWYQKQFKEKRFLMSAEDLANIGPLALIQDLAVQALLGNASIERNGHHYFRGLSMFPGSISSEVLQSHPDLYNLTSQGHATLLINNGVISLKSVNSAPFGYVNFPSLTPVTGRSST